MGVYKVIRLYYFFYLFSSTVNTYESKIFSIFFLTILSTLSFGLPFHALHLNCPVNRDLFSIKYIPIRCQPSNPFKKFSSVFPLAARTSHSVVPFVSYTSGTALAHPLMFGNAVIFSYCYRLLHSTPSRTFLARMQMHTTDDTRRD